MPRQYNVEEIMGQTVIWYEENGVRYSFMKNESNSDYQRYLLHLAGEEDTKTLS